MNTAGLVKEHVSMEQVIKMCGFETKKNIMLCPFHIEKTPSFKIYDKSYYCFGCGVSGDIYSFLMALYGLDFKTVLLRINNYFGLNLIDCKVDVRKKELMRKQRQKLEQKKKEKQELKKNLDLLFDCYCWEYRLCRDVTTDRQSSITDEYVDAINRMQLLEYKIDFMIENGLEAIL